ncbi:MAG: DUF72 domain-containing protein [Chloroflexota bacterium]
MARIHVDTCSWADHTNFYPPDLPSNQQIAYYAQRFPVVEIDASFYRLMPQRNYALWAERTPPGFLFDAKPYKQMTWHDRQNPPDDAQSRQYAATLEPLRQAGKLGAVHMQFPPWFTFRSDNLDYILHARGLFADDRFAVEFRHRSWLEPANVSTLCETLRAHAISLTVVDEPQLGSGSVPTVLEVTSPDLAIVRFHGRNYQKWYAKVARTGERFDYLYSEDELREWVPHLRALAEGAREIHALFNNNAQDYAVRNGRQLRLLLRESLPEAEVVASPVEETP